MSQGLALGVNRIVLGAKDVIEHALIHLALFRQISVPLIVDVQKMLSINGRKADAEGLCGASEWLEIHAASVPAFAEVRLHIICGGGMVSEPSPFPPDHNMATKLSVNLNAVAQLRNRRDLPWPSVTGLGRIALEAGAHGLTVHPRPDQRHTRFSDLPELRAMIDAEFPQAEFNIEGYPSDDFLEMCEQNRPEQVTLVPDDPAQATSDHGWDFVANHNYLAPIVARLKEGGMRVSLFADAEPEQVQMAASTGADRIELYTGPYGGMFDDESAAADEIEKLGKTADAALALGLAVNAGHDLTVANLPALIARVPGLAEVSIGHGFTADALTYGFEGTTRRFLGALARPKAA